MNKRYARFARSLLSSTSTDRLGIRRVQRLGAFLCQRKKLWCKPNYPIRMKLLNLKEVAATNFIDASIRRHFKNAPPVAFFGLLRGPLTLSKPTSLGFALLFGLFLVSGLLFRAIPALLDGPPFRIALRLLASRA